jgi:hypothetical protein
MLDWCNRCTYRTVSSRYSLYYLPSHNALINIVCQFILQWVIKGVLDVDIGANPSAEGGDDEGDQVLKVVDIIDTFRLQVAPSSPYLLFSYFLLSLIITIVATCRNKLLLTRSSLSHTSSDT